MTNRTDAARDTFDFAILGGGSGGMAAARRARDAGLSVVLFERRVAGGTCVNRGCVPKKLFVHASRQGDTLRESRALGWSTGDIGFDWATLRDKVDAEIRGLGRSQRESLIEAGVHYVDADAKLVAADRVRTDDGSEYRARHVVLATGTRPLIPDLPGVEHAIDSDRLFALETLPERIAMVGGGYIAIEFACMLSRFGVEVTIFESSGRILDGFESEIVELLQASMQEQGIVIHTDSKAAGIAKPDGRLSLELDSGERHDGFDRIALLIGRSPNTEDIGLEELGVALDEHGQIEVDEHGRTSVDGVYAIGDVARQPQLTPIAIADGHNVVDGIVGRTFEPIRKDRVPAAVYATPELGSVGLDEDDARERDLAVEVRRASFSPLSDMIAAHDKKTLVKLVVERGSGTLLGVHAFGEGAAETTQFAAMLIASGASEHDLHRTISLHPTDAEEITSAAHASRPV